MKPRLTVEERIALLALLLCLALIVIAAFCIASAQGATMTDTKAMVPPAVTNAARVWYFAATATDSDGLESDYSNELVWTNTTGASRIMLGWDASPSSNIVNYTVFRGLASGTYTFEPVHAGTNLSVAFWLVRAPKTNRVVHVSSVNATSMWTSATLKGPWIQVAATNVSLTNPAPSQFWRVEQPAKVVITKEML
jgi:hypothetical protein